jgi:hypothetical protein
MRGVPWIHSLGERADGATLRACTPRRAVLPLAGVANKGFMRRGVARRLIAAAAAGGDANSAAAVAAAAAAPLLLKLSTPDHEAKESASSAPTKGQWLLPRSHVA